MPKKVAHILDKKNAKGKARVLVRTVSAMAGGLNKRFTEDDKHNAERDRKIALLTTVLKAWVDYLSLPWWKRLVTRKPQ